MRQKAEAMLDERGIPEITQREFEEFRKFMYVRTGIDLGPNKRALVQSRLARRVGHLGLQSFAAYWKRVCAPEGGAERQCKRRREMGPFSGGVR